MRQTTTKTKDVRYKAPLLIVSALVVAFLGLKTPIASAQTYIELFPSIDTAGVVIGSGCPWGSGDIFGYKDYKGIYNSGTLVASGNTDTICGVYVGGYGYKMEKGWANGAITTTDGTYYTFITHSGSAYTPNWTTGTTYYWRAVRYGGSWSGVMSDFITTTPIRYAL